MACDVESQRCDRRRKLQESRTEGVDKRCASRFRYVKTMKSSDVEIFELGDGDGDNEVRPKP